MPVNETYRAQVDLLIRCLPAVAKDHSFALKGGTAINLFFHDMPRLSVDIDLTFLPITDRDTSLAAIADGLVKIGEEIRKTIPQAQVQSTGTDAPKLHIATPQARIRVEPSPIPGGACFHQSKLTCARRHRTNMNYLCAFFAWPQRIYTGGSYARRSAGNIPAIYLTSSSFKTPGKSPMTSGKHSSSTLLAIAGPPC